MNAVHVDGTRDLLAASVGRVGRWVQLSSVGVYGPVRAGVVTEESLPVPVGCYETAKLMSDELVLAAVRRTGLKAVILRLSIILATDMPNNSLRQMVRLSRGSSPSPGRHLNERWGQDSGYGEPRVRYVPLFIADFQMGGISTRNWRATLRGTLETLRSRRQHLGAPPVDIAVVLRLVRRLFQLRSLSHYFGA